MRSIYAQSTWHHEGADLHHAMLGRSLGGGVAYLSQICSPSYGFAVSGSLSGSFSSMEASAVWDMVSRRCMARRDMFSHRFS